MKRMLLPLVPILPAIAIYFLLIHNMEEGIIKDGLFMGLAISFVIGLVWGLGSGRKETDTDTKPSE